MSVLHLLLPRTEPTLTPITPAILLVLTLLVLHLLVLYLLTTAPTIQHTLLLSARITVPILNTYQHQFQKIQDPFHKSLVSTVKNLDITLIHVKGFDNPDLILFTETHLLSDPKNPKHPLPAIKKLYKHFALGCCASNSGGIAILSKNPIIVHYTHKSGNLIHFSVVDDMNNSIPFIHCYASPSRRQYYYRLILKRSNIIPESIITGDLNTAIINDSYFKSLIFNPLCLTPNQDLTTSKPTFFPRGKGSPKSLDCILLPPSFLDFNVSTSLLPQTSPPISDHLLVTVTLKHNNVDDQNSNFQKRKSPISTSLFRKKEIQEM